MDPTVYAAILAVTAPLSFMTWLAITGDRAGLKNIQSNLGQRPHSGKSALSAKKRRAKRGRFANYWNYLRRPVSR